MVIYKQINKKALPIPSFIPRDSTAIISEMVADYELRIGRTLEPAQVETLLINGFAYRELLLRNQIQDAALQNTVEHARFPIIAFLGGAIFQLIWVFIQKIFKQ